MKIRPTRLAGVHVLELDCFRDSRGVFVRTFCRDAFTESGLNASWLQTNVSLTKHRGMLRGLHFQKAPAGEIKLIECLTGVIFDVIVDLRRESPSYGLWEAFELSGDQPTAIYAPAGCAHGFQCLSDDCRVLYHMSVAYDARLSSGVRWNDPTLGVTWPLEGPTLSERDALLPMLSELS